MKIYITADFINDLKDSGDLRFIRQVLRHSIENDGAFRVDGDDHRYHGIKDAWIRYVSDSDRVIFIKKDEDIYLYRAGRHSIENNLPKPNLSKGSILVNEFNLNAQPSYPTDLGSLLKTIEPAFLFKIITSLYHVGHREIILVSPFIAQDVISRYHHFGRFLDKAVEENTIVQIITRPPPLDKIPVFKDLESRTIFVFFHESLHTKLYLFDINRDTLQDYNKGMLNVAVLGSSNLTKAGFGFDDCRPNDELCYKLPKELFYDV